MEANHSHNRVGRNDIETQLNAEHQRPSKWEFILSHDEKVIKGLRRAICMEFKLTIIIRPKGYLLP